VSKDGSSLRVPEAPDTDDERLRGPNKPARRTILEPARKPGRRPMTRSGQTVVGGLRRVLDRLCSTVTALAITLLLLGLCAVAVVIIINVIGRSFFSYSILWADDVGMIMLTLLAFIGSALSYDRAADVKLSLLHQRLGPSGQDALEGVKDAVTAVFGIVVADISWTYAQSARSSTDPLLHLSEFWTALPLVIGMAMFALFGLRRLLAARPPSYRFGNILGLVIMAGIYVAQNAVGDEMSNGASVLVLAGTSAVALLCGFPLGIVFGLGSLAYLYLGGTPLSTLPLDMQDGVSSFVLVAIPFFLLVGFVMGYSMLSERLAGGVRALTGRLPGGMLQVIVLSMMVMSGISGSKIGDMAAVGEPAVRMARTEGYSGEEATSVLVAGAIMGDTVPPSIALLVLASISTLSVGSLFAAGLIPALVVGVALLGIIWYRHRGRRPVLVQQGPWRRTALVKALPVATIPVILVGGIVTGIATPSEVGSVAVVYTVGLAMLVVPRLSLRRLYEAAVAAVVLSGSVLIIVATTTVFSRILTLANVPQDISNWLGSDNIGGRFGFLVISSVALIVLGTVMEGIPCIIVLAPLLIPTAEGLGINALQFGILIVMAVGIGANCPPLGIGALVGAQIGGVDVGKMGRQMLPYLVTAVVAYAVVAAVPSLVTYLPHVLGVS
jgi:tripartite ATP-independent transporter DctM subunit